MPGSAAAPNTIGTEGNAECSCSGGLVVDNARDKVVSDDMAAAAAEIDAVSRPRLAVILLYAVDSVLLDGCAGRVRAVHTDIYAVC